MACNCFEKIGAQLKKRLLEVHGDKVAELDEARWAHSVYVLANGDHAPVALQYDFKFFKRRKNGELEKRRTDGGTILTMNFCPHCGTKFEGSPKKEEATDGAQ